MLRNWRYSMRYHQQASPIPGCAVARETEIQLHNSLLVCLYLQIALFSSPLGRERNTKYWSAQPLLVSYSGWSGVDR